MKFKIPLFILGLALLGIFAGSQIQKNIDQKQLSQILKKHERIINELKKSEIFFIILGTPKTHEIQKKESIMFMENLLRTKELPLVLKLVENIKFLDLFSLPRNSYLMMLSSPLQIEPDERISNLEPLFFGSPDSSIRCYSEIQIFTKQDSNIQKIDDLYKKNVAFSKDSIPYSFFPFEHLKINNFQFNQVSIYSNTTWATENLNSGKIDAFVDVVSNFDNKRIWSNFGNFSNDSYPLLPSAKVIVTTNNKIPCFVIGIKSSVPKDIKNEISKHFASVFSSDNKLDLVKNFPIGSLFKVEENEWSETVKKINSLTNLRPEKYSSDVSFHP